MENELPVMPEVPPQEGDSDQASPSQAADEAGVFELELTAMAHGGSAIGRHEGRAIFVPYAIPGERITARITSDKGRFALAEGVMLLEPSEARVYPLCPHFGPGRCGGCHWQHMEYPAQLALKQQVVVDQMNRIGGFRDAEALVQPTLPSPEPWQYRSHVTFHVTQGGKLGFVSTDDLHVLPIEECHIIRPELLELFDQFDVEALEGEALQQVRMQVGTESDERLLALSVVDDELPSLEIDLPASVSLLNRNGEALPLIGPGQVHYVIRGRRFRVTAGSFFQVNLPLAEKLVELVLDQLALRGTESVLDLYSGVGLFAAFVAEQASLVTAIESYPAAVDDADVNLADLTNVDLVQGAVEDALPELDGPYQAAVLDPPRSGLEPAALDALVAHGPARIVYVSCDPATLARDAKRLVAHGYRLLAVQPVDMFPQTYHIEAVATLAR